jgi:large subunit ribosomal protein L25
MAKEVVLEVKKRKIGTGGDLNIFRKQGFVPGVLYGGRKDTITILVNKRSLMDALHTEMGSHVIFSLNVEGEKAEQYAILKDRQKDPISQDLMHIDFQRISMQEAIEVSVAFKIIGEAPGVKAGGVLELVLHEVKISCLPKDMPQNIEVNVGALEIGNSVHIKDLVLPKGVKVLADAENIVLHVASPTKLEEKPATEEAAASAEPEVISKGKKDEEGEASAEKPKKEEKK